VGKKDSTRGYIVVNVDGRFFKASRIIWRMVTGQDPGELLIDHIDGDPSNDRFDNLRVATTCQDAFNSRTYRTRLSGLPKGVVRRGSKYRARIGDGGCIDLGTYDTLEQAHDAYIRASRSICGEFASGGRS
jgi:hypothetical protein